MFCFADPIPPPSSTRFLILNIPEHKSWLVPFAGLVPRPGPGPARLGFRRSPPPPFWPHPWSRPNLSHNECLFFFVFSPTNPESQIPPPFCLAYPAARPVGSKKKFKLESSSTGRCRDSCVSYYGPTEPEPPTYVKSSDDVTPGRVSNGGVSCDWEVVLLVGLQSCMNNEIP